MKCPNPKCRAEVGEDDTYCEKCGKPLRADVNAKWKIIAVALVLSAVLVGYWAFAVKLTPIHAIAPTSTPTIASTPTHPVALTSILTPIPAPTPNAITPTFQSSYIGMEFVLIPAGEFDMGSTSTEVDKFDYEGPLHHVRIGSAFYIGKYEVTQKQWREVMGTNPSNLTGDDLLPVENVSWNDVQQFIKKLNDKESTTKYRLPSEAEWEYAARAGTTTKYSFGNDDSKLGDYAWYSDNSASKTHPVGQKKPNAWRLYDVHGNVYEWVQDIYHNSYNGAPTDGSEWEENDGCCRVFRGGGWNDIARYCWSAFRSNNHPASRSSVVGFRLLRDL